VKKGDELFVYGTLRQGERADLSRSASKFSVEFLGKDAINGKLYHLGAYPGLKLISGLDPLDFDTSKPLVVGEVFYVKDESVCSLLDAYEGYNSENPSQGLYNRAQVASRNGRILWAYTYNPRVTDDQLIETGDWHNPRIVGSHKMPTIITGKRK